MERVLYINKGIRGTDSVGYCFLVASSECSLVSLEMTDLRSLSKNVIEDFLALYKSFPCLWKLKSKEYSDRVAKRKAYKVLVDKLKESILNCTRELVLKKIDSLRGNFRKEYKKVVASQKSGAKPKDVYVPTLWYYDKLLFLKDQEVPRKKINTRNIRDGGDRTKKNREKSVVSQYLENSDSFSNTSLEDTSIPESTPNLPTLKNPPSTPHSQSSILKRKSDQTQYNDVFQQVQKRMKEEDECDIVGKNFACKLRLLPVDVRIKTEKLMGDILFEAMMGNVNFDTTMSLSNRF